MRLQFFKDLSCNVGIPWRDMRECERESEEEKNEKRKQKKRIKRRL